VVQVLCCSPVCLAKATEKKKDCRGGGLMLGEEEFFLFDQSCGSSNYFIVWKMATQERNLECKVVGEEVVWQGKWIKTKEVRWSDQHNVTRVWEAVERTNHSQAPVDAVEIIPILRKRGAPNHLVLVRQFRPPPAKYCLELPAGLCDKSEDPGECALRELREETGYEGALVDVSCSLMFGMALANTTCAVVTVTVDGDHPSNNDPKPKNDDGEFTEVLLAPVDGLLDFLHKFEAAGDGVDGKVWLVAHTLRHADLLQKSSL